MAPQFGTHRGEEPARLRRFGRSAAALAVVGACAVVGILASLQGAAPSAAPVNAAVNSAASNRNHISLSLVPGIESKTAEVMDMETNGHRWAMFEFLPCCTASPACSAVECMMVPTTEGESSSDWDADWKSFVSALPANHVAAAVYNFQYFTGPSTSHVKPILVTWAPPGTPARDLAQVGYFLGALLVATKGVHEHYPLSEVGETYQEFCKEVMEIDADMCALEREFHNCPFSEESDSPCKATACDGAAFVNPDRPHDEGAIPVECCEFIVQYCDKTENDNAEGCDEGTKDIVTRLCETAATDQSPELVEYEID